MTVRALDQNGDISTSGVQFLTDQSEVVQTIKTRLNLYLGEYFRNVNIGTPWFQAILGKGGTLSSKDAAIKIRISQTKGVSQLLKFESDYDIELRKYTISATVLTDFGAIDLQTSGGA